ncbi:MAG: aminotransferase class IV family protein [Sedimentisphaerales bacterium]|nr:aminotransferase class IV family protein [Sedimentisphaerales bacterium]
MAEKVFLNDKLIDTEKASLPVTDSGFLYGAGLFETMRSCAGVVFCLEDHLDRLFASAASLAITPPYDKTYVSEAVDQVLRANELTDARLRLTLTGGPMMATKQQRHPTLLVTAAPWQPYPAEFYDAGVTVILCPYRQNDTEPTCGHKTTSYFPRLLALGLAQRNQAAEALWFTPDNRLAEGCVSNVFLVKDNTLCTPSVETPVLPGIARKTVCRIAGREAMALIEKDLYIADVLEADEVFLTNVVMEVLPVTNVEKHPVGSGKVGPVARMLRERFTETIEQQCRRKK